MREALKLWRWREKGDTRPWKYTDVAPDDADRHWNNVHEIEALIVSHPLSEAGTSVEVKPLEWVFEGGTFSAKSVAGRYSIMRRDGDWLCLHEGLSVGYFDDGSIEPVKAAAQADYRTRVLSALIQPTPAETEPVASWDREHNIVSIAQVEGWEPLWPQAALDGMTARVRMEMDAGAELAKKLYAYEAQVSTLSRHLEETREALFWAMDEIDHLSNKLSGWAYPQGMSAAGRPNQLDAYRKAVDARRAARRAKETVSHG